MRKTVLALTVALFFVAFVACSQSVPLIVPSFSDIHADNPFFSYVETVGSRGWTSGCGGGQFCGNLSVSRAEIAVWTVLGLHKSEPGYHPRPATGVFADVPIDSPLAPWIEECAAAGITVGCSFTSSGQPLFCPNAKVTRHQAAVMVLVAADRTANPTCEGLFTDLPCSSPYARWSEEMVRRNIMGLCGDHLFCTLEEVTRQQMMVYLVKAFGL